MNLDQINSFAYRMNLRLQPAFFIISGLYFLVGSVFFLSRDVRSTELVFIRDLYFVLDHGFWEASARRVSIPYMLLAFPLAKLFSPVVALRVLSVLLIGFLLLYVSKIKKFQTDVIFYFLFFFGSAGFFFEGVNDVLFIAGLVIFFTEAMLYLDDTLNYNMEVGFIGLIIAFFTREIIWMFTIPVLLSIYLFFKSGWIPLLKKSVSPLVILIAFLALNLPSLLQNGKLSYQDKSPPIEVKANWAQRQYLAKLMINDSDSQESSGPSWEETDLYIDENGTESLPSNTFQSLIMDPEVAILEFFRNVVTSLLFAIRGIGFMLIFVFFYFFRGYFSRNESWSVLFLPVSLIATSVFISLLVISDVLPKWYAPLLLSAIIFFSEQVRRERYSHLFKAINFGTLVVMLFFGMYNWTFN